MDAKNNVSDKRQKQSSFISIIKETPTKRMGLKEIESIPNKET